ncbi:hypothetical protein [Caballeronia hypogeia]|uniref:hypothetical protein n=1 Tax=Caballeronia hypogeia TaxID=1777140 RepID=UPI0012FD892F|nr:hypothetical protein [Caballeronia hypogeia]
MHGSLCLFIDDFVPAQEHRFRVLARTDALRTNPSRAGRTLRKHRMLQMIGDERIERHCDALVRFSLYMKTAQSVIRERRTAADRRVIERKRRDRDGVRFINGKRVQWRVRVAPNAPERDAADEQVAVPEQFAQRHRWWTVAALAARGAVERVGVHHGRRTES